METVFCARCDRDKQLGHLDPDNLRWYCEECWMEFSGKSRLCFRCRDFVPNGSVDARDKRWYCTKCWEFYTKEPAPRSLRRGRSRSLSRYRRGLSPARRSPPRQFPTQRVFLTPNPAILPSHMNQCALQLQPKQSQQPQQSQQVLPQPQQPSYAMPQQQPQQSLPPMQQPLAPPPQQFQQHAPQVQPPFAPQPPHFQQAQQPYMSQPMPQPQPQVFVHSQPPPQPYQPPPVSMPDISYGLPSQNSNNGLLQPNAAFLNNTLPSMPVPDFGPNPFSSLAHLLDGPYGKGGKKGKKMGKDNGKSAKKGKVSLIPGKGLEDAKTKGKLGARGGFYDQPGMSPSTNSNPLPRYHGVVKGYNAKNGYGFVYCLDTAAIYGRDVFIHKTQMSEALGIDLNEHPEMRNEDFEVAIEFSVIVNDKGLPQARDCWLLEDEAVRTQLMVDAGIDPAKRTGFGNPLNFADPLTEPPVQMRPPPPLQIPPPPPAVRPDDADDSDKDSSDSDKDNQSNSSDKDDSDKDDSDKDDSDKDSDKDSDDVADHDDGDAKSNASD